MNILTNKSILSYCTAAILSGFFAPLSADCKDSLAKFRGGISSNIEHTNRLKNSIQEINYVFPFLKDKVTGYVVDQSELLAETDGNFCIIISKGFMDKIYQDPKNNSLSDAMLTFILGHELGHSILNHHRSCISGGSKSLSEDVENKADSFGGFLIFALDESLDAPGKVFKLIQDNSKTKGADCHGDPEKREAMLLQNIGTIKYNAKIFKEAMDMVMQGDAPEVKEGISKIEKVVKNLKPMGIDRTGVFDFALATSYHRLWMIEGNDPEKLILQTFLYYPENISPLKSRSKDNGIPGNLNYYKTARKHYESYLKNYPNDNFAEMNLTLLYMYDKSMEYKFISQLQKLQIQPKEDAIFYNNLGVMNLFDSIRKKSSDVSRSEKYFKHALLLLGKGTENPALEAGVLFNLYRLYSHSKSKDLEKKYAYEYSRHSSSDIAWKSLMPIELVENNSKHSPIFVDRAGEFQLGMKLSQATKVLEDAKLNMDSKEFYGYLLLYAKKDNEIIYKLWFKDNSLIKLILYSDSNITVNGVKCGDPRKRIPTTLGYPMVRGNMLIYPGTNISFKTKIINNQEVISQIEVKLLDTKF